MGRRLSRLLGVYLIGEAAVHDSLSLVGGVVAVAHGLWFGWVLVGWAASEWVLKTIAGRLLWDKKEDSALYQVVPQVAISH